MKVLSGHDVCKSLTTNSMDVISMQAPVHAGLYLSQQTNTSLPNTSHTENMNINQRRWKSIFRRVQKKQINSGHVSVLPKHPLFGQALSDVCGKDGCPPKPIMDVLTLLLKKGLYTEGVFRKAGNARTLREIKAQLNDGMEVDLEEHTVFLLADLLKDFLRHIPGSLLMVEHYKSWMAAMETQDVDQKCAEVQMVVNVLPDPNIQLLKLLMVLLYHISENADTNKMDSNNLAVCISPNLLQTEVEKIPQVTILTQFLIDNCCKIFGEDALNLFGDSDEDELSDNQDSFSSNHHDSAYDSYDPDVDGYKGSNSDMESIKSVVEEKPQSPTPVEPWTTKLLTRRRSEPTFAFSQGVPKQLALTRSQTQMDFHDKLLTKQISDDCILLRASNSLGNSSGLAPKRGARPTSKDCSYCSSSSLESCFSSASESSIHNSPPIASLSNQRRLLQRKHSLPTRMSMPAQNRSETPKRRSQSMKTAHLRSRTVFGRSGSTKRAIERTLRHSQTLPEVLKPQTEPSASFCEPRRLSSEEVFQQVDSRIPSDPPCYEQAVQENSHAVLSNRGSLTVQDARCLQTHSRSTSPSKETLESSSSNEDYDIDNRDDKDTCCESMSEGSSESRQRSASETMCEASVPVWCDQEHVRETYV
ncbi:T cell activation RhoGTPase activating protein a [Triplophysa rosa]|uniref:T-cell activation Rho GTPase-activating protein n=1 Tax=Triplophysa rosa TaxID=992332 RepID=A0A9W7TX66_TRIRA|nr:T cell activation RhoGTPase activating protein a [Triplophysa rosa]KAI7804776.1 putative T-cell activation Rho GTPase-activating protein [Triplophysa rosa]